MRSMLIHRWETSIGDISVLCSALRDVLPDIPAKSRGRPPKHPLKDYLLLLVVKESKRSSLRSAETDWSQLVCGERIDHSVLAYWEQRIPRDALQRAVRMLGARLQALLGYLFSMIDATAFATWHHRTVSFHVLNRVCDGTVYPVSIAPDSYDPIPNVQSTLVLGEGFLMADRWYDVNGVYRVAERHGYVPLIKPKRNAGSGKWRRRGWKVWIRCWRQYRQRGRGESMFGSLTNAYGDRLASRRRETTYCRSACRVLAYQARLLARVRAIVLFLRHAHDLSGNRIDRCGIVGLTPKTD